MNVVRKTDTGEGMMEWRDVNHNGMEYREGEG